MKRTLSFGLAFLLLFGILVSIGICKKAAETANPTSLRIIIMADSRGDGSSKDHFMDTPAITQTLKTIKKLVPQPAFAVIPGDLVFGPNFGKNPDFQVVQTQLMDFKKTITSIYPITFFYPGIGNHESRYNDTERLGMNSFGKVFKEFKPTQFAPKYSRTAYYLDQGNTRIFVLNNTAPAPDGDYKKYYIVPDDEFNWLKKNIDPKKKHNFFIMHAPLYTTRIKNPEVEDGEPPRSEELENKQESKNDQLWDLIATANGPIIFCGHQHFYSRMHKTTPKTIYQVTTGTFGAPFAVKPSPTGNAGSIQADSFKSPTKIIDVHPILKYHFAIIDVDDKTIKVKVCSYDDPDPNSNDKKYILDQFQQ